METCHLVAFLFFLFLAKVAERVFPSAKGPQVGITMR